MIPTELTIVTISAFVAALNQATKYIGNNFIKRDISKYIPICSVIYGLILGIIGFTDMIPTKISKSSTHYKKTITTV